MRSGVTQVVPTGSPYVQIVCNGDTHTSEGGSGNDLLMRVYTDEQAWGGQYTIELDNSDETLNSKDYTGYPLDLKWGYVGETQSVMPKLWVWSQQHISRDGKLLLILNVVDVWAFIAAHDATVANASYNQEWQQSGELSQRYMADGTTLLSDGDATLYAKLLANGDKTIKEILTDFCTATVLDVTLSSTWDDDGYVNDLKPPITIGNARTGMWSLMDLTKCYLKWNTSDELQIYQPDAHATVHTFNQLNTFYMEVDEAGLTVPNIVVFWSYDDDGDAWIYSDWEVGAHGVDATSRTRTGQDIFKHFMVADMDNTNMRTQAALDDYADAAIAKIQAERNQGFLVAPMHCSLELFDKIQVNDNRYTSGGDRVITGYVHRIIREYDRGVYRCTIYLGGVTGGYTPPDGDEGHGMDGGEAPTVPSLVDVPNWFDIIPKAVQGYTHDITFSSTDWDTVAWTSGTLTFYDGSTQAVSAGSTGNLSTDDIYYIYFDLDDASPNVLKVATATAYQSAIDEYTSPLCVAQRRSGATASFLPGWEKQPLIVTDMIHMQGLVDYDYGGGQYLQTLLNTQVTAGQIRLSSSTSFASNYDPTDKYDLVGNDLDDIAETGSTWGLLRLTDISGGHIKLTSAVVVDGEWYNESGVILDSGKGIRLYGTDLAFATFANVTDARAGTNYQCKMDTSGRLICGAGNVRLDSNGIRTYGTAILQMYSGASHIADFGADAYGLRIQTQANRNINITTTGTASAGAGIHIWAETDEPFDLAGENLVCTFDEIDMGSGGHLELPHASSNPSSVDEGTIYHNTGDGEVMIYTDAGSGLGWYHFALVWEG